MGLVCAIDGKPRREVVELAIRALKAVWHRGAVDADGKTGDGAGVLVSRAAGLLRRPGGRRIGHALRPGPIAVGQVFLPRTDLGAQEACRTIVEAEALRFGFYIYGWRQVPVDTSVIGEKANATRPEIEQIMLARPGRPGGRGAGARPVPVPQADREARRRRPNIQHFYICSLSARALIYKGMFLAEHIDAFYPDLTDERFAGGGGDLPPALFDQHLPGMAAGPAVPDAGPQRRDQHPEGQRQLDEDPRDPHGGRRLRRVRGRREAGDPAGRLRTRRPSTTPSRCWSAPAATRRWPRPC